MPTKYIAVLVGSLRRGSFNRMMANVLIRLAPEFLKLEIVEFGGLDLYNQDLDEAPPKAWVDFRNALRRYDGFLFVTPEYNRSIPGVLKNAIDVGSRPYGQSAWEGKPGAVVSVSTGRTGGFGANHHLRQTLVFLNVPSLQQPEIYIGNAHELFNEKGDLNNDKTRDLMQNFIVAFADWVLQNHAGKSLNIAS